MTYTVTLARFTLLAVLLLADDGGAAVAQDLPAAAPEEMTFRQSRNGGNCDHCIWLSAEGTITERTPIRLKALLRQHGDPSGWRLYLHSPGGDLAAGIRLGRLIREHGLETVVGQSVLAELGGLAPKDLEKIEPGLCASACAWAFLGGTVRSLHPGSKIGFHQFYRVLDPEERVEEALNVLQTKTPIFSRDQLISGLLVEYLLAMDIDPRVFRLSAEAGPAETNFPDTDDLSELRVVSPSGLGSWDLEPYRGGLVAFAQEADKTSLLKQVTVFCRPDGEVILMGTSASHPQRQPMFEPSKYGSDTWWPGIELEVDGRVFEIPHDRISERFSDEGVHYAMAELLPQEIKTLLSSQSLEVTYATARYLGQRSTEGTLNDQDRDSLRLTLKNCVGG